MALVAPATAETEWMNDLPAAQQRAAAEGKAVLVDFTGSDWCGWCIRLKKDVFDTPAFEEYAADKFVLTEVDVPRREDFDPELRARNEALCNSFGISGFPTVLVLTPQGTIAGGFVGGRPDFDSVREPLEAALANARALQEAQQLPDGEEKAKALFAVYSAIPDQLAESETDLAQEIVRLDPEDTTGMQTMVRTREQKAALMEKLKGAHGDPDALLAILNEELPQALPGNRGAMLNLKAQLQLSTAETEDDIAAAKTTALEAADCEPETAEENKAGIERAFADPAALLERARQYRERRSKM